MLILFKQRRLPACRGGMHLPPVQREVQRLYKAGLPSLAHESESPHVMHMELYLMMYYYRIRRCEKSQVRLAHMQSLFADQGMTTMKWWVALSCFVLCGGERIYPAARFFYSYKAIVSLPPSRLPVPPNLHLRPASLKAEDGGVSLTDLFTHFEAALAAAAAQTPLKWP